MKLYLRLLYVNHAIEIVFLLRLCYIVFLFYSHDYLYMLIASENLFFVYSQFSNIVERCVRQVAKYFQVQINRNMIILLISCLLMCSIIEVRARFFVNYT